MIDKFNFHKKWLDKILCVDYSLSDEEKLQILNNICVFMFDEKFEVFTPKSKIVFDMLLPELEKEKKFITSFEGRRCREYRNWRKTVLERDNFVCQKCGSKKDLEVHHIKPFIDYPHLRTDIKNGITLCFNCHKGVHKK